MASKREVHINSRDKGARGERALAHRFEEYGYTEARRGQQYSGLHGDADVVGVSKYLHIECKYGHYGHGDGNKWINQSKRDAREGEVPIVCHKRISDKDRGNPWLVTMLLDDWIALWKAYELQRSSEETGEEDDGNLQERTDGILDGHENL